MTYESFWNSSMIDVFDTIEGFRQRESEAWQRTRFQSYILYCSVTDESKIKSIYEFLELESDPTPEEIADMEKKEAETQIDSAVEAYNSWLKNHL